VCELHAAPKELPCLVSLPFAAERRAEVDERERERQACPRALELRDGLLERGDAVLAPAGQPGDAEGRADHLWRAPRWCRRELLADERVRFGAAVEREQRERQLGAPGQKARVPDLVQLQVSPEQLEIPPGPLCISSGERQPCTREQ